MSETTSRSPRYTAVAITLHWLIALAMGSMIAIGWNMHPEGREPIAWLFQLHKSIGITILVLTIARVGWRVANPPPPLPAEMPARDKAASHAVHMAFYGLMVIMPLSGWVLVSISPFAISTVLYGTVGWPHLPGLPGLALGTREAIYPFVEFIHSKLAWVMISLVVLHVAGALKHELSDEEGVLKRMLPGLFGKAGPPKMPARGAITSFGAALIFFGVVAGSPVLAQALGSSPSEQATLGNQNWVVDADASSITFSGVYQGNPFSGEFEAWTAAIAYDPANPADMEADVLVETGSAVTGNTLWDSTIDGAEWFNISAFPQAKVIVQGAREADAGFATDLSLTIKDVTINPEFAFTLTDQADGAILMEGSVTLTRDSLNLGQQSDASGAYVSNDILVDVRVLARPDTAAD